MYSVYIFIIYISIRTIYTLCSLGCVRGLDGFFPLHNEYFKDDYFVDEWTAQRSVVDSFLIPSQAMDLNYIKGKLSPYRVFGCTPFRVLFGNASCRLRSITSATAIHNTLTEVT